MALLQHSINIADTTLHFTVEGSGTPLLVVGSAVFYPRTFSSTLKQSCRIVCADLPHFVPPGTNFKPGSISFELYANCIEAIRRAAGLEQVVIVGHSHHGNIALEYAKRYADKVSHVVLIGTPPVDIADTVHGSERHWDMHASAERKALLHARRQAMDAGHLHSLTPEAAYVTQYLADAPLYWYDAAYDASALWRGMTFDIQAVRAFRDLYQVYQMQWDADRMKAPVLVVMGLHDYAVAHTLWEPVLPQLQNVTFKVLDRSGHTPQLEQSELFDRILLEWLSL